MRTVSAASLARLNQNLGTEPTNIIEIDWGNGNSITYSDNDKVLEIGELDHVVNIFNSGASQEISIRLDDTNGSIKSIFDAQEIHEVAIRVYQLFDGLSVDEKFLVFSGKVSSPIIWKEAD